MRKIISILLVVVMMFSLVSCGGGEKATEKKEDKTTAKQEEKKETKKEETKKDETKKDESSKEQTNGNASPLSDVRVRQAIAYAIDMDAIIESLMGGKAIPADALTPNGEWKADGLNAYKYDPDKARALLKEANWDPNYEVDCVFYYSDQLTVDLLTAVQAYLQDVGMKMSFRKLEGDLAAQLWVAPKDVENGPSEVEWDLAYAGIAALGLNEYYNRFRSGNPANSHTPKMVEFDDMIDFVNSTADVAKQKEGYAKIQKFENEFLPIIPLYYQQIFAVESKKVNRNGAPYGNEQFNYDWDIVNWDVEPTNGEKVLLTNGAPAEFFEAPFVNPGRDMTTKVLFDHLIVADENLDPKEGQMVSDYKLSDDGLTLEMTLKDGLKWHDGTDITPADVKGTFEFLAKVAATNPTFSNTVSSLEGFEAYTKGEAKEITGITIDGMKITFKFAKLDPNMMMTFTQLPPLPMAYFKDIDPLKVQQASFWQNPVGSGPFKLEEVKMNNYVTLVPFKEYHDGVAKIEKIRAYPSTESDKNLTTNAAAGQLDYAYTKSVENVKALEGMDNMVVTPIDIRYTRLLYVNKFPKK